MLNEEESQSHRYKVTFTVNRLQRPCSNSEPSTKSFKGIYLGKKNFVTSVISVR